MSFSSVCESRYLCHSAVYVKVGTCVIQQIKTIRTTDFLSFIKIQKSQYLCTKYSILFRNNIQSHFTHIFNAYSTRRHKKSHVKYTRKKQMCIEHTGGIQ